MLQLSDKLWREAEIAVGGRERGLGICCVRKPVCERFLLEFRYAILPAPVHTENCIRASTMLI